MRQSCLAGHYSINHSRLITAPMRAAFSQSVFVEFEVPMDKSIITVGDANSSGGKVIIGPAGHTSMVKDALQLEPTPPWIAIPKVDMALSDFLMPVFIS